MMKRFLIAAIALAATLPAAINVQAQDDDIYFSKKANKQAKYDAIYASAEADSWTTDANNDWNLDDYNRRGTDSSAKSGNDDKEIVFADDAPFYYAVIDEKGDTVLIKGDKNKISDADMNTYKIIRDTVVLIEQYHFSDLIRRFHNPFFGYYRYSPWYDVAFYDPFYWDYCYYDPWWYVTPSFGFHYGGWYGGWSYGYYTGWYGGWYSPFYSPMPHFHHFGYYDYYDGPVYNYATGSAHRGSSRNNFGGHFAHRGGWKGDGGSTSRLASASTNRSYRAENGARVGFTNSNGTYTAGPTMRGRNTVNGRLANSTMRSHSRDISNSSATNLGVSRGGSITTPVTGGSYSSRSHSATRYDRNSSTSASRYNNNGTTASTPSSRGGSGSTGSRSRRSTYASSNSGFSGPADNSVFRRAEHNYSPSQSSSSSSYSRSYDNGSSSSSSYSRSSSSYSSGNTSTRGNYSSSSSSSSYSSGSSSGGSSSGGGSYSRGGGSSHSSGSSHGRR